MTPDSTIIGLCGSSGSGKTRACQMLVTELASRRVGCCGFISPAVFETSQKTGINVRWLESNHEEVLMTLATATSQVTFGKWQVFPEAFEWIIHQLGDMKGCQAFFCDEIGPMEVLDGKGWIKALDIVDERRYVVNVITFRLTLRDYFSQRFPDITIFDLDREGVEKQVSNLVNGLFGID